MPILVTGAAGFIGHAVSHALLDRGETVIGIDNLNDYYDVRLKRDRLATLSARTGFAFEAIDIADAGAVAGIVASRGIDRVIHLAAQAGVRYSLQNPLAYERSNLAGHLAVLEACRAADVAHLVYASSSSVYGDRPLDGQGFREDDPAETPVSLYAATKRACELMSQSYTMFGFPQTGLRFFTVYGPWGRPDMAYFFFTQKMLAGEPIEIFGEGKLARDFTYIDDIVAGILGALDNPPARHAHRVLNIGNCRPETVLTMVQSLEAALGVKATMVMKPKPPGDVTATFADVTRLHALTGYAPKVSIGEGLVRFADWFRGYYRIG
ncbi:MULTISPECIES: NAD-dependent epimerase/dehydratase family protein [Sphingomonas]|uniref:NAD-dependent epimerase/dehydratase family protein n=1 Tax=Sphingomonas TaxID=13687 RepID=UPI0008310BF5|nr:NAD-dependent epimerase/dehydratase family protein [Sphingomonas sp. CCH10-B3]